MIGFSVIIPTYNREQLLKRAIDSVISQSHPLWELIVVDDGSTDTTLDTLKALQKNWSHPQKLTVLKQSNKGVSAARNLGVKSAQFAWLAFLDSDDEWLNSKLQAQNKIIISNPDSTLVHCEEIWVRNGVRVNQMNKHKKQGGRIFTNCLPLCCISPSATALKKEVFNRHGGFREDYLACEDYDLWLKITSQHKVDFIDTPQIIKYGGHEDQLSRKFIAMDYWRIKSLFSVKDSPHISAEEKQDLHKVALKKCKILLKGYEKHNNLDNYDEIFKIYKEFQN